MPERSLFMVSIDLDRERLFVFARQTGLPLTQVDTGYLLHAALRALFGRYAPQPFALTTTAGRDLRLLGYSDRSHGELRTHAEAFAEPLVFGCCNWDRLASKPMPSRWDTGRVLGFEVRVCPIIRVAHDGPKQRQGAEVDVFLARCWAAGEGVPVSRESVYGEWLTGQLARYGARVATMGLKRFQRERLARRDRREEPRWVRCERPDATMAGTLEITDGLAFPTVLARGVGRHRAFGYGMLLLRPPEGN